MILTVTVIVIVSLPEHAFATPCIGPQISTCDCRRTIVDCESGLTAIPGGVPSSTTLLDLRENAISSVPGGVLSNNTNLRIIDLSYNSISTIAANAFDGLVQLLILRLSNNKISTITANTFDELVSLKTLTLSINKISTIAANAFDYLVSLEELYWNENDISSLPDGLFLNNINLRIIYLPTNNLSSLPSGFFQSIINLEDLYLFDNRLSFLSPEMFHSNTKLKKLQLRNNPLVCCNMTDFFQWAITAQLEGDTIECTDLSISILLQKFDISKCTITVDGQWGSWSPASCSATCGNGVQYRKRTCNDPSPSNGGKDCQGVDNETSGCNSGECSVDGQWGSWSPASCSATCGNGVQYRKRTCNDPSPSNGGKDCQGVDNETSGCNSGECSVDGQWGSWTTSSCSETCGNGVQYRNRTCNDPSPSNGGKDCQGVDNESSDCNSGDCSVDGQWGSWTTTLCSVTCGNGVQYRKRTCNDPSPSNGGKDCQGVDNESSDCNSGDCSVDGHWGPWLPVTCSVTCGNGIGIRTRRCDNPPPSGNGNSCVGCDMERKLCSLAKCHKSCKDEGKNQKTDAEYQRARKLESKFYHIFMKNILK